MSMPGDSDGELSYNVRDLSGKFNKKKFLSSERILSRQPVLLRYDYLKSAYRMVLPNMTMRSIYGLLQPTEQDQVTPVVTSRFMNFMIPISFEPCAEPFRAISGTIPAQVFR